MTFRKLVAGFLIITPACLPATLGQAPLSNEELLKRVLELEQQVRVLGRKDELQEEAASEKAKTAVLVSAGAGGFQIRSADTNFVLKIRGYLQADSRLYINDNVPVNDTFLLRRVRPIFEGTVFEKFDYRLMLDFGSGVTANNANNAYVQDAYFNARFYPEFQVQAGKFKEPVGLERLQSGANLLFVERSYPTQLLPNRDVGVQVQGDIGEGLLSYTLGAFNGVTDGGSGDIDRTDDEKDIAGRVFANPFKNSEVEALQGLGFGVAGTFGNHAGALRGFTSPGQQSIFEYYSGTGTNANTVADGTVWRLSPQAYYYWGPLGVLAEYAVSSSEASRTGAGVTATDDLQHSGWQVAVSYFLTGEDNSFKAVTPRRPFTLGAGGGWGAWEVAARISGLKLDDDTFPTFASANNASEAISYAAGLNWHLNRNFKLNLNYEHTDFEGGSANPVVAEGEDVVLTRAQISF